MSARRCGRRRNGRAIAAAAAIAGLTRWVRPPAPWRPSKLRLLVEAQRSPGSSRSAFIARHIEQPGSRHSKPAALKIASRPSRSACSFTRPEPGTTIASLTLLATLLAERRTTAAASRRSSMRELVHEPMNTLSMRMSSIALVRLQRHVGQRALRSRRACRRPFPCRDRARGRRSPSTISGDVPQVTCGVISAASSVDDGVELRARRRSAACASRRPPGPTRRRRARTDGP